MATSSPAARLGTVAVCVILTGVFALAAVAVPGRWRGRLPGVWAIQVCLWCGLAANLAYMSAERVRGIALFRGAQAKVRLAEGFEPVRLLRTTPGEL
jgi:hypothetical protein